MKKILLLSLLTIVACGEDKKTTDTKKTSLEVYETTMEEEYDDNEGEDERVIGEVTFKDESLFSKQFVEALKNSEYPDDIYVMDTCMIVGKDTVSLTNLFIQFPAKGNERTFKGKQDGKLYTLIVKHTTVVDMAYSFKIEESGKEDEVKTGNACIVPLYFLGSESIDDENGNGIFCDEYYNDDVRIRLCDADNNELRAMFDAYDVLLFEQ